MGEIVNIGPQPLASEQTPEPKPACHLCPAQSHNVCDSCGKPYCSDHTSNVDLSKCQTCCESVEIVVTRQTKQTEDYDEWKDEMVTTKSSFKNIHFTGAHWIKNALIIEQLPDVKLQEAIEYHKGMISQMEFELTSRRIHRNKLNFGFPTSPKRTRKGERIVEVTEKKTKTIRTKAVKAPKTEDMVDKLLANMDKEALAKLIQQKLDALKLKKLQNM